jgi:hypothetical protein
MTIIYTYQKSKKRKQNAKQKQLDESWQELVQKWAPQKTIKVKSVSVKIPSLTAPPGRETPHYPSLSTSLYNCAKKEPLYYTGDKMKGIGTLHKSNAVPIFTDEEAKDQANMRR